MSSSENPPTSSSQNTPRKPGQSWASVIEERLREAQERGDFDRLAGAGRPLPDLNDPTDDPDWMSNHILKSAGFVPPAIDLSQEVRRDREAAAHILERLGAQRARTLRHVPIQPADQAAFNALRARLLEEYRSALLALNRKVLALNLSAPAALHQRGYRVDIEMERASALYPPL